MGRDPSDQEGKVSELSFDELYALYATDVLRVSYYYLGDRQRAEDVTQDVFIRYLQNRPALVSGREKSSAMAPSRMHDSEKLIMKAISAEPPISFNRVRSFIE